MVCCFAGTACHQYCMVTVSQGGFPCELVAGLGCLRLHLITLIGGYPNNACKEDCRTRICSASTSRQPLHNAGAECRLLRAAAEKWKWALKAERKADTDVSRPRWMAATSRVVCTAPQVERDATAARLRMPDPGRRRQELEEHLERISGRLGHSNARRVRGRMRCDGLHHRRKNYARRARHSMRSASAPATHTAEPAIQRATANEFSAPSRGQRCSSPSPRGHVAGGAAPPP